MLRPLGQGGMGTVYLGEDANGRLLAIKVIRPEYSGNEQFRRRFEREVEAARRVPQFTTAEVVEAALTGAQLYLVTEYIEGPDLDEFVKQSGHLKGAALHGFAVNLATALVAIHEVGLVHRDLKPSNVLLSLSGWRVIDFGIARPLDALADITAHGQVVGTPRYTAPEILRGEKVTAACDVFAWGCLVVFAATGHPPFEGDISGDISVVRQQILDAEPRLDFLKSDLHELVRAALAKTPGLRPTAQQLLDHLLGRSDDDPTQVRTTSPVTAPTGQEAPPNTETLIFREEAPDDAALSSSEDDPRRRTNRRSVRRAGRVAAGVVAGALAGWLGISPPWASGPPQDLPVLFQDDFEQYGSGWSGGNYYLDSDYGFGYASGGFYAIDISGSRTSGMTSVAPIPGMALRSDKSSHPSTPERLPERVAIFVDLSTRQGTTGRGTYGVFCRGNLNSEQTRYEFLLDAVGGARIRRLQNGAGWNLANIQVGTAAKDGYRRLQVECSEQPDGLRLSMWLDGEHVESVTDGFPLPNGAAGIVVNVPDRASVMKASFDDFKASGTFASAT
ncbi:serine/threonine protein kinase [Sphaerisporangium sp. NBC_01403]|uniref:serine/threonine protein kinase n=1 Tax=Sphaerisporangium sp. NBC_01403 TaxID=2903599 RepID=UPI00324B7020